MSKTAYHISLKGYVGGYDFDRSTVDRELAKYNQRDGSFGYHLLNI